MGKKSENQFKFSSIQNIRNGLFDTLSMSTIKPTTPKKGKIKYRKGYSNIERKDDDKKEQVKESIKYEKYKGLSEVLALWYTAQDQLRKGMNPQLCTKYGIRLNAPKETDKNKVLRMVSEFRRHTELMATRVNCDPSSINPEDDEDAEEGDGLVISPNSRKSFNSFQGMAPRHEPVDYDIKGIR